MKKFYVLYIYIVYTVNMGELGSIVALGEVLGLACTRSISRTV